MLTTTASEFGGQRRTGVVPIQMSDGGRQLGRTLQARDQSGAEQYRADRRKHSTIAQLPAIRYPYKVPAIQVKRPRTHLELIRDIVWPVTVIAFIALKLTGVIPWSWWWVLSPLWGGLVLNVLAIGGVLVMAMSCPRGFTVTDRQTETPPDLPSC
jgi:hypothetical protein